MQTQVTFRHMETSPRLKEYVEKKVHRFSKITGGRIGDLQVVIFQEKLDTVVELVGTLHGHTIKATERGTDAYAATDIVVDRFERQALKVRDRIQQRYKGTRTKEA